jgi:MFS transporter, NNP family, nitrate/nitrite transporter
MFDVKLLWKNPEVNPVNHKARSIPLLNVFNVYGRVFFFSWFGFLLGMFLSRVTAFDPYTDSLTAFWSWYAVPPLVSHRQMREADVSP